MNKSSMKFWLMKTEPDVYSIDTLQKDKKTPWDGVRNYQARNFMRDDMKMGDKVLIYHSNTKPPGIVGLGEVVSTPYPDPTDEKWIAIDIGFIKKFPRMISLYELRDDEKLQTMLVIKKGMRLSIQPVTKHEYTHICNLADTK